MNQIYEHIIRKNPRGLRHEVAVQLFLWLYCSSDSLPSSLRHIPLDKELLIETFQRLSEDGLISAPFEAGSSSAQESAAWNDLVDALLSNRIAFDPEFVKRASQYL